MDVDHRVEERLIRSASHEPKTPLFLLGRPQGKPPLGEPPLKNPKFLTVMDQEFERRRVAIAEDENGAREGI